MTIELIDIGKRFNTDWIFRHLNTTFTSDNPTVVLGSNGSGKSTLLQVIAGKQLSSEGNIHYQSNSGESVDVEAIYRQVAICSPFLELYDAFTLQESLELHQQFKPFRNGLTPAEIIQLTGLPGTGKALKFFSSGMRQRVKLALAILSDTSILMLDEPLSNLDAQGIEWYKQLVADHTANRTVIVSSNSVKDEYFFCTQQLSLS